MKRSELNAIMRDAVAFIDEMNFKLPPFAFWTPEDWKDKDVDRIVAAVVEHVKDGDIILMHDIFDTSVDAALRVVDNLLSEGYCFVTVEQLMEERQVEPAEGTVFRALPPKGEDGKSSGS